MKYDKNKSFGYPVLNSYQRAGEQDYPDKSFMPSLSLYWDKDEPEFYRIEYEFYTNEPSIIKAIKGGKASYALSVKCRKTFYGETINIPWGGSGDCKGSMEIPGEKLRDDVVLHGFIVAKEAFEIDSKSLHEEYAGRTFPVESGSVLGWGDPVTYFIGKENLGNITSLFAYETSSEVPNYEFLVDLDTDKVKIIGSEKLIAKLRDVEQSGAKGIAFLNNVICVPALVRMAQTLASEPEESGEKRWGRALNSLLMQHALQLDCDPIKVAHVLLDQPLKPLLEKYWGEV